MDGNSKLDFQRVDFIGNQANGQGGAIFSSGASATFNAESSFTSNSGGWPGGALSLLSGSSVVFGKPVNFTSNTCSQQGGAINSDSSSVVFNDTVSFTRNKANGDGGGLKSDNGGKLEFKKSADFTANEAGGSGGGFYSSRPVTFTTAMTFTSNRAYSGAGFFATSAAALITFAEPANFFNNYATWQGEWLQVSLPFNGNNWRSDVSFDPFDLP